MSNLCSIRLIDLGEPKGAPIISTLSGAAVGIISAVSPRRLVAGIIGKILPCHQQIRIRIPCSTISPGAVRCQALTHNPIGHLTHPLALPLPLATNGEVHKVSASLSNLKFQALKHSLI